MATLRISDEQYLVQSVHGASLLLNPDKPVIKQ